MGALLAMVVGEIVSTTTNKIRININGLSGSGKTTIMHKLAAMEKGYVTSRAPTIGVRHERLELNEFEVVSWDMDQQYYPPFEYYANVKAIMWVIDSYGDKQKMELICKELHTMLQNKQLTNAILIILCNKHSDKHEDETMSIIEIMNEMNVNEIKQEWMIHASNGKNGDGLDVAMNWITTRLKQEQYEYNKSGQLIKWISKHNYTLVTENKSILLISGWIRNVDLEYQLWIPGSLCKLIHGFYRKMDSSVKCNPVHKYKFYGESFDIYGVL